jgi:hypothetical protein
MKQHVDLQHIMTLVTYTGKTGTVLAYFSTRQHSTELINSQRNQK